MPGRMFLNPSQDELDNRVDMSDYFGFTSGHPGGPKIAGLVVYEPRKGTEPGRHSRFFRDFKQAEREYGWTQVIRPPKERLTVY